MARKTIILNTGNIYHVMNRGVEKRDIFTCDSDYYRFIRDLYEFNDKDSTEWNFRHNFAGFAGSDPGDFIRKVHSRKKRKLLVDILAFCLMPNHFHLLLRQVSDRGISLFMQKLGGYTVYFNKKYERVGSLFQSRYKAVEITDDRQLTTIFSYIHTNPIELVEHTWKTSGVKNFVNAKRQLHEWRWSSYLDYIGRKNFPSVIDRNLFMELFGGPKGCEHAVRDWVKYKAQQYEDWKDIALD